MSPWIKISRPDNADEPRFFDIPWVDKFSAEERKREKMPTHEPCKTLKRLVSDEKIQG